MRIFILMSPQTEAQSHEISGEVMSPFCPGRSLNDCPSSSATELRNQISSMLEQGKNKEQILDTLYSQYGNEIRSMPKAEGFGLIGWTSPLIFVLLGLTVLTFWLRKHKPQAEIPEKKLDISSDMRKRIEEEIYGKN